MKQQKRSEISRKEIIEEALLEFAINGYEKASLRAICQKAGYSKGGLYHHFNSKEDLFLACCEHVYKEFTDALAAFEVDLELDFEENMVRFAHILMEMSRSHISYKPIMFIAMITPPAGCEEQIEVMRERLDAEIISAVEEKIFPSEAQTPAAEIVSAFFVTILYTMFHKGMAGWSPTDPELCKNTSLKNEAMIRHILHNYLYGVLNEHDRALGKQLGADFVK